MPWEVEIKGWVDDTDDVLEKLRAQCLELGPLHKEDRYFENPDDRSKRFRLRRDEGKAVVTVKSKEVRSGGEVNREVEFGVDDPDSFIQFTELIGFRTDYRKTKRGYRFVLDDALLELCEVVDLGWFLEVEIVLQGDEEAAIEAAQGKVRLLLLSFGIEPERIESRFYSELLRAVRG